MVRFSTPSKRFAIRILSFEFGGIRRIIGANSANIGAAFLAISLVSSLAMRSFHSPLLGLGWVALALGCAFTGIRIGNKWVFWALIGLLASHALAIPGSLLWGTGNWELTAGVVMWMAPAMFLYLANGASRVFTWLIPAFVFHAGLILYQGLTGSKWIEAVLLPGATPTGLANNPNLAAGFLAIGIIYLLTMRKGPGIALSLPLLAALLFTGSRWGLAVTVLMVLALAMTRVIPVKFLGIAVAGLAVGVLILAAVPGNTLQVAGYGSITQAMNDSPTDIGVRLAIPHLPSFLPHGVAEHPGLHNVPLRIAVENGIIAAAIWVCLTAFAIRFRFNTINPAKHREPDVAHQPDQFRYRWTLAVLVLLSILDYYTWMGHLGGFWWLLIGLLTKRE